MMLLAAISVGVISMATLTATAQPKKTVKIKPLNTKKWEKYDVGSIRFTTRRPTPRVHRFTTV